MFLDTFMESYRSNVVINTTNSTEYDKIFEGVLPCSYEDAIDTVYEAQYSIEAIAAINENAILMNEAGAAALNEGFIKSTASAVIEKIKSCAAKIKQFAVACIKKVTQFFQELYMKNNPVDKIMRATNKEVVTMEQIKMAKANGWKLPGHLYKLSGMLDAIGIVEATLYSDEQWMAEAANTIANSADNEEAARNTASKVKELLNTQKEKDKEKFTAIGRLMSDDDTFSKSKLAKQVMYRDKSAEDQDISDNEWKAITDFALHGQSFMKKYVASIKKECNDAVKEIEAAVKEAQKAVGGKNTSGGALAQTCGTYATYLANRTINITQRVVLPVMKKQHRAAIATFVYVQGGVKRSLKKASAK